MKLGMNTTGLILAASMMLPGITALAVTALLRSKRVTPGEPTVTKALAYLEQFVGPKGGPLRRGNFSGVWRLIAREAGLEQLRFHDLRHTGNTLAAITGASTKELMTRMGHSSTRAALGYQHATEERERLIATKLSEMISDVRATGRAPERH